MGATLPGLKVPKVAGLSLYEGINIFQFIQLFKPYMALGFTQLLTELIARNAFKE
jgi:hypothetical protein